MTLARANSVGPRSERDSLFQTLLTPKGARPPSPLFPPSSPRRTQWQLLATAMLPLTALAILLLTAKLYMPATYDAHHEWKQDGCQVKILDFNSGMNSTLTHAKASGALLSDIGAPVARKPRTAILNAVKFHTEVVASLAYHFKKLNHNVTIYARDDYLGMQGVVHPFHWAGFRRYERFYTEFYNYDTILVVTFPTCHLETVANLAALDLPQRYIAIVHNPELLAADDVANLLESAQDKIQLLTIAPHVNAFANAILEGEGLAGGSGGSGVASSDWFVPLFPVLFPEDCENKHTASPSGDASQQPACNRSAIWQRIDEIPPPELAGTVSIPMHAEDSRGRSLSSASEKDKNKEYTTTAPQPQQHQQPQRHSFCVQGKLDPTRRSYSSLFTDVSSRRRSLLASDFSLVLLGKGGGPQGTEVLDVPSFLEEQGLVQRYTSLPYQEYYEVLHSCLAIIPAFASDSYYTEKGSSSVAASLIAGTPLIATPGLLAAYSFLDASSTFLVPNGVDAVDAMQAVAALSPELLEAKVAALERVRRLVYERNFAVLQVVVGDERLYKRKGKKDGEYVTQWYDGGGPLWTAE